MMNAPESRGVIGLGIDLVEIPRLAGVIERQGDAFLRRIFTEQERAYCSSKSEPAAFYAARFAAKEAVAKAFGTGIGREIGWLDIEVTHLETGAPMVRLHGAGVELARQRGVKSVLVSLTHTGSTAGATVLLQ